MLCEQIPELEVVKAFNDPQLFLKESPLLQFDFCIIDIEMPK
jgi:DNA-binding NarL/FixJ family response regulator